MTPEADGVCSFSLRALADGIREGESSPVEATEACLRRKKSAEAVALINEAIGDRAADAAVLLELAEVSDHWNFGHEQRLIDAARARGGVTQAGTQCLGKSLLGGETLRQETRLRLRLLERQPFLLGKDTLRESIAKARQRFLDTRDFDDRRAPTTAGTRPARAPRSGGRRAPAGRRAA